MTGSHPPKRVIGGVIHTYQKYDPNRFPSPTTEPPDLVSGAFEHLLAFGSVRQLTPEELASAIRLDPSQFSGLGPSLDSIKAMLLERKRKILEKYETSSVRHLAQQQFEQQARSVRPPKKFSQQYYQAIRDEQIYDLERLWFRLGQDGSLFAGKLVQLMERLGEKYEIEELAAKFEFVGRESLTIPMALAIKEELEKIEQLLEQIEKALENAQLVIIDMDLLSEFTDPSEIENLSALQQQIADYVREMAARQGMEHTGGEFRLTPQAYRLFQDRLLDRVFGDLQASRSGRHHGPVVGEGAVEMQQTKPYEFGDSLNQMDIPQSMINAMLRGGPGLPVRIKPEDIEIHRTRNSPKCATVVVMDMSGSMRYMGQYIHVKRMALALDGLIRSEYPGDFCRFVEMATFAKLRRSGEIAQLMPKPVTIQDPVVRLKADMSNEDVSESWIHPHFTNIQHGLSLARIQLATQNTPNRQIVLITDGLPTAHFEGSTLYMLYPPDPRTESVTMREARMCHKEGITINIFLIPSWSQSQEDVQFAHRLASSTRGRVFFTAGNDLDRYVVWDYLAQKREILG